jgi:hypothetical protein
MSARMRSPFGLADCESELRTLNDDYSEIYFDETPFNLPAIKPETYLIVGRRGSGKTALSRYFSFQKILDNPIYIDVDEPEVYQTVLSDIAARASECREIAIPRLKKVWEYVLWCVVCEHTKCESEAIKHAFRESGSPGNPSHVINRTIDRLLDLLHETDDKRVDEHLELLLGNDRLETAKVEVLRIAARRPIIIALDTLERYDVSDPALMNAMAALVQCAANFNLNFSDQGLHLKAFISGELFPYLEEEFIQNPLKSIKDPVYLFWRPKDLLRLISWRFHRYLDTDNLLRAESKGQIDWTKHDDVFNKMWVPYFGNHVTNARGLQEDTFSYVLRHTQMRPRQLILLCNGIAERAKENGHFPSFTQEDIRLGVKDGETKLAVEIINSFRSIYPNVSTIVDALMKMPMLFTGNELDRRAKQSASEWPKGTYSPARFRRLVAELGIVGRVRRHNAESGYIDADFEYSLRERLPITHRDECVIHPMFYSRLNVELNSPSRVLPFSTARGLEEANERSA